VWVRLQGTQTRENKGSNYSRNKMGQTHRELVGRRNGEDRTSRGDIKGNLLIECGYISYMGNKMMFMFLAYWIEGGIFY
jgi:hypothetical protein